MSAEDFGAAGARFWMVWRAGAAGPTHKHATADLAYAEARRLAAAHPGARFYVLEAIGTVAGQVSVESRALGPLDYEPHPAVVLKGIPITPASVPGPITWATPARAPLGDLPPGQAYDYRPLPARGIADA